MFDRVASAATKALMGALVAVATAYRETRDFFEARKEAPFRGR